MIRRFFSRQSTSLNGAVAVITGAGGGIGRELALVLARERCQLALVDINASALAVTADLARRYALNVSHHVTDVTSREQMAALAASVAETYGVIDILINNAGITLQKSFAMHSMADLHRIVDINLWGVLNGCHFFLPYLRKSRRAHIVNLSSMAAFIGMPSQSTYCATKAAVRALSEALWAELAADNIGVTCVHPGAIRTEMIKHTLESAEDTSIALRNYDLAMRIGVDPDKAARKIIAAMRSNRQRVCIGADSFLFDIVKRLFPTAVHYPFRWLFKSQMRERRTS
jgi:short-subunit dehydrogenase